MGEVAAIVALNLDLEIDLWPPADEITRLTQERRNVVERPAHAPVTDQMLVRIHVPRFPSALFDRAEPPLPTTQSMGDGSRLAPVGRKPNAV